MRGPEFCRHIFQACFPLENYSFAQLVAKDANLITLIPFNAKSELFLDHW